MILDLYNNLITNVGGAIFTIIFNFIIFSILIYLCVRYFRYIYRFELFTIRHIRVRFNRVTRQVYIQRPKYCGGTVVFKWEHIMPSNFGETGSDMGGTNMVNLMTFHPYKTGFPIAHSVGIGKNTYNPQDYKDEWEFIRRYMEHGRDNLPKPHKTGFPIAHSVGIGKNTYNPQDYKDEWEFIRRYMEHGRDNLPKPRLSTHLPMPFHGFSGHVSPMIHAVKNAPTFWMYILLIPVFLILLPFYTVGYFISECLCWQPRWPKVIRQAGKTGKPIPKETTLSDYPETVQQAILDSRLEWGVRDEKTGKLVDYGNG